MAAEHVERIGGRIRARREELNLSRRKAVAKMEGQATENDLYRWEKGLHRPSDDNLAALARALGTDVVTFLVDAPEPGTADLMGALSEEPTQLQRVEAKLDATMRALTVSLTVDRSDEAVDEVLREMREFLHEEDARDD